MNWQEFTALLVLATAMSFSPGPNTTLSTALAANGGLKRAMRFVVAVPVGWSALLLLCAGGVGALVTAAPTARVAIKVLQMRKSEAKAHGNDRRGRIFVTVTQEETDAALEKKLAAVERRLAKQKQAGAE